MKLREPDSNRRSSGYEPDGIPSSTTPLFIEKKRGAGQVLCWAASLIGQFSKEFDPLAKVIAVAPRSFLYKFTDFDIAVQLKTNIAFARQHITSPFIKNNLVPVSQIEGDAVDLILYSLKCYAIYENTTVQFVQ